jgi:hypothetical protein
VHKQKRLICGVGVKKPMPNAIVFVREVIVMDGPMWTRTSESRWPRLGMEEWTGCCQDCNIMKLKMGGRIFPLFCDYYASSTPTPAIKNGVTHIIVSKKSIFRIMLGHF